MVFKISTLLDGVKKIREVGSRIRYHFPINLTIA